MVVLDDVPHVETGYGLLTGFLACGPNTCDKNTATCITRIHILVGRTVGRLIIENGGDDSVEARDRNMLSTALVPASCWKGNVKTRFMVTSFGGEKE